VPYRRRDMEVKMESEWRNKKNGFIYGVIIGCVTDCTDERDESGVLYTDGTSPLYRELSDFLDKFEEVK
jgi:hypothetical protein